MNNFSKRPVAKRLFVNTIYSYIGSVTAALISFFILRFLTNTLSIEEFGRYNVILSTLVFSVLLFNFGLPSAVLRYASECIAKENYNTIRTIIKNSTLFIGIVAVLVFGVTFLGSAYFKSALYKFALFPYFSIVVLVGALRVEVRILESVFCAFVRQGVRNIIDVAAVLIKLLLFVAAIRLGYGLIGLVIAMGAVELFLACAYYLRIRHYIPKGNIKAGSIERDRFLRFGAKEYFAKLFSFFWDNRVDAYIIMWLLGNSPTGIFYFAVTISSMLAEYMPGSITQQVLQGLYARNYSWDNNMENLSYMFALNNRLSFFFAFPIFLGSALFIDKATAIFFKPTYLASVYIYSIIIFFTLFYILLLPLRSLITALEKNEISLIGNLIIIYKIPAAIFLTLRFGLIGTAIAFGTTYMLHYLINFFLMRRVIKIHIPFRSFLKTIVNSGIVGAMALLLKPFVTDIVSLIGVLILCAAGYAAISYLNKPFSAYDRTLLGRSFGKLAWVF